MRYLVFVLLLLPSGCATWNPTIEIKFPLPTTCEAPANAQCMEEK